MKITYIHHSCYVAESEKAMIVFDYWEDPEGRLLQMLDHTRKEVYFLVSHFHEDHYNPVILDFEGRHIVSYDTQKRRRIAPERVTAVMRPDEDYHDDLLSIHAFKSTDVGLCYLVRVDGETLFHAGDYNNWYFERGDEHLKVSAREMEGLYLSILKKIKAEAPQIGHVMFPIDPRIEEHTLRGIRQFLNAIDTQNLYPMHTWGKDISPFLEELRKDTDANIHWTDPA